MKSPIRIGFLSSQIDDPYQNAVWNGALEEAFASNLTLMFYANTNLADSAFNLVGKNDLSALIVMTNSLGPELPHVTIAECLARFTRIPLISIGIDFPGVPSICVENSQCVRNLTEHLVHAHGRKKFVFLAGQRGHQEGTKREREFRETHKALLGDGTEPLVLECNFVEGAAYAAISHAIEGGWDYDAVIAANDQMAMGAIRALEEHGIAVPADVSVTGYDNIEDSYYSIPPLTTVQQPMGEIGAKAVRFVAARLGLLAEEPPLTGLLSACIIRESCGCKRRGGGDAYQPSLRASGKQTREQKMEHRVRYQMSQRVAVESRFGMLQRFESSLTEALFMDDLLKTIALGITAQGIDFCAIVLFAGMDADKDRASKDHSGKGATDWAKLMMISHGRQIRILTPYGLRFRTMEILPGGLPDDLVSYVCEPLQAGTEALGYLVCSADANDRNIYAVLRDQVSAAMKRTILIELERDREKALALEVRRRTSELSLANKRLKDEISQRTRLERELLEISNNIMTRIGQDIHDDLCQDLAGISVLGATLVGSLTREGNPQAKLAARITETASQTARHAKQIARELYPAEFEATGIVSAVTQLVNSKRSDTGPELTLAIQDGLFIHGSEKAIQLFRILQEAFNNALKHSGATRIKVSMAMNHEVIEIEVADNGTGIARTDGPSQGMGLKILKYRANVINGKLRIKTDENGTVVSCRVAR